MFHVEHLKESKMRSRFYIFASFLCISLALSACSQPRPNPELVDPIYTDLMKEADSYERSAADAEKKVEESKLELSKAGPRDSNRGRLTKMVYAREREATQLKQMATYYRIRAEQRKEFDQTDYLKAFHAGKGDEWPPRDEYQAYMLRKRLQAAPKNWDARVPKSTRYSKAYADTETKKQSAEKGKDGGSAHGASGEAKSGH